jgi:hypothetical protein
MSSTLSANQSRKPRTHVGNCESSAYDRFHGIDVLILPPSDKPTRQGRLPKRAAIVPIRWQSLPWRSKATRKAVLGGSIYGRIWLQPALPGITRPCQRESVGWSYSLSIIAEQALVPV